MLGAAAILLALGFLVAYPRQQPVAGPAAPGAETPARVETVADAGAVRRAPIQASAPRPVAPSALLERPAVAANAPAPRSLVQLAPEAAPSGPTDRRANPGPDSKRQMEILRYGFETLDEDIEECLKQWDAVQPGQATEVMIAFDIDADGLQKSWLEHEGEIPFGPRTCLANAVYGLDWSHIVDHPAKLTNRFALGRDAGK